jgi:hypothetical protein
MAMLGSECNSCCGDGGPCPCEPGGELPDTVTVTLSGPQGTKEQGPPLLSLEFKACFGSGASGTATAPGGVPGEDIGSISGVTLTAAGSGYAKLGRSVPTLSVANKSDEPASVTLNVTKNKDACGLPYWSITSATITDGGLGYKAEALDVALPEGGVEETAAVATLEVGNVEPTLEATASPGTGATFEVTVAENDPPGTWGVTAVAVSGSTSGYEDESVLLFSGDSVVEQVAAVARIITVRSEPTLELYLESYVGGSGAVLSGSIVQNNTEGTPATWGFESISIDDGGSEYGSGDRVRVTILDGQHSASAGPELDALVTAIDENGAITEIVLFHGGNYYKPDPTGAIDYVWIESVGEYYAEGVLTGVAITNGGRYYVEDATLSPLVADVTVSVRQLWPGDGGAGAEISATVNSNTSSPNFGKIQSLSVDDGGDGYLGWRWLYSCDCDWVYSPGEESEPQDRTIVCWRWRDEFPDEGFPARSCKFIGYQCWPSGPVNLHGYGLVWAKISSAVQTKYVLVFAPAGTPGVDNGPISNFDEEYFSNVAKDGWAYIDEDTSEVVAPEITIEVIDFLPSQGSEAVIEVTSFDTDPNSNNFGRIGIAITAGGSGYLGSVRYSTSLGRSPVIVTYPGPNLPPTVTVYRLGLPDDLTQPWARDDTGDYCTNTLTADAPVTCGDFSFEATFGDQTATVEPGGDVTEIFEGSNKCCERCYVDCPERPTQVSVALSREAASGHVLREEDNAVSPNYNLGIFNDPGVQEYGFVECDAHELELVFDLLDLIEDRDLCSLTICMPFSGLGGGGGGLLACPGPFEGGAVSMTECLQQEERDEFLRPDFLDAVYDTNEVFGLVIPKEATHAYASLRIIGPSQSPTASVFFQSAWWTSPPVTCTEFTPYGRPVSLKQKTYTLRAGEACSEFPNSFDLVETESGTAQEGTYEFDYGGITVGVHRRICHHYDMQVEFS